VWRVNQGLPEEADVKVSGKIGVGSKADSVVYFDDYRVALKPGIH
jgi:hypothetical protein